jgi:tRNA G26 N,N-dimethylase Trm1
MREITGELSDDTMVEIFKTNIISKNDAQRMLNLLSDKYPNLKINFDLNDCDKILRIEGESIEPEKIIELIYTSGYQCEVLV